MDETFHLVVNGQPRTLTTDPERPLLGVLREDLGLHGTRFGCGEGQCAACTVMLDGARAYACRTTMAEADGREVLTIEGLAKNNTLHAVQQAFLDEGAYQCGYCTSGMIMGAVALLEEKPKPTDAEITAWMNRHLCRCGGYVKIIAAVKRAAGLTGASS
jgi:aerobic-type carbon monoxide dehydrogenase small subunit (CoxS/CutS family)